MGRLKIVHIIQLLGTGGAEKLITELTIRAKSRHDVRIICLYPSRDYPYENLMREHQIEMIFLNKKLGFDIKTLMVLWRTLSEIKPDVVHTHLHAAIYALPWFIFHRKNRRIHTVHNMASMEFGKAHRILQGLAYRCLNIVPVAISHAIQEGIIKEYGLAPQKVPIIYNGIDIQKFSPKTHIETQASYTIINVASLSGRKNQALLIDAVSLLLKQKIDVRLVLVGDGEEKNNLQSLAGKYKISDKVVFAGITSEVWKWLSGADIFVLCSFFEGLPLSIIEAMAVGLPVVATEVGGVPDILENGVNGFLVPSGDAEGLSRAILKLIQDKGLRCQMAINNIEKARNFDIDHVADQYMKLYCKSGVD